MFLVYTFFGLWLVLTFIFVVGMAVKKAKNGDLLYGKVDWKDPYWIAGVVGLICWFLMWVAKYYA